MGLNASRLRFLPLTARVNTQISNQQPTEEKKETQSTEETFTDKSSDMQTQLEAIGNNNISFIDFSSTLKQTTKGQVKVPQMRTQAVGESGDAPVITQAIGEGGQDPVVVTQAIGESGTAPVITQAIGESGQDPVVVTQAIGEGGLNPFEPIMIPKDETAEISEQPLKEDISEIIGSISPVTIPDSIPVPKGAEVKINDDGTIDVIITHSGYFIGGSSPQTVMHYDSEGNLLTRTEYSAFDEKTSTRTTLVYDKYDNMTGGEIKFGNGKTVEIPANSAIKYVDTNNNGIVTTTIDVITTEIFSNIAVYDPTQTFVDQKVTTQHYDTEGNKTGTNVVTKTRNPNATINADYEEITNCFDSSMVSPLVSGGTISFDTGAKDFSIPKNSFIRFKGGKIIVTVFRNGKIIRYTLGNNGVEGIEIKPFILLDTSASVISKETISLSDWQDIFGDSDSDIQIPIEEDMIATDILQDETDENNETLNTNIQSEVRAVLEKNKLFAQRKQFKTFS